MFYFLLIFHKAVHIRESKRNGHYMVNNKLINRSSFRKQNKTCYFFKKIQPFTELHNSDYFSDKLIELYIDNTNFVRVAFESGWPYRDTNTKTFN